MVGWPEPLRRPVDRPESWKVYVVCVAERPGANTTMADVRALGSVADKEAARNSYIKFLNRAQTGVNLSALYDEGECHVAFTYTREDGSIEKVWRIWGNSKTRLYFVYLPDRRIVLLKTLAKRVDQLSEGEESEIRDIAEAVIQTYQSMGFREV